MQINWEFWDTPVACVYKMQKSIQISLFKRILHIS